MTDWQPARGNFLKNISPRLAIERLTALWALSEGGLGGVLHAVKIPFKGIGLSGSAVLLLTLIAFFARMEDRETGKNHTYRTVLTSLVVVLIIKAMTSPHSPLQAYLSVSFQGMMAALLFSLAKNLRIAALLLAVSALLQAALQKVIVLTLLFGNPLWKSMDSFGNYVLEEAGAKGTVQFSYWVIGFYLGIHLLAGCAIGWMAGRFPAWMEQAPVIEVSPGLQKMSASQKAKLKPWWKRKSWMAMPVLALLLAALTLYLPQPNRWEQSGIVMVRFLLVFLIWYVLIAPLLLKGLHQLLRRQQGRYSAEVQQVLEMLPALRALVGPVWQLAAQYRGWRRYRAFAILLIAAVISTRSQPPD